jgi:hypothetical protein
VLTSAEAEKEDSVYWHSKTPAERLAAAEQLPPEFKELLSALSLKKVE